jgi:MFS family permease
VFLNPEGSGTALGVAKAYAILVIPFSIVGPFAGVFIDRWSRRRILQITPLVRTAGVLALLPVVGDSLFLYAPALLVVSVDRFYLATAGAVMPSVVADRNLLVGNSMATVGGTVAMFAGLIAGTKLADPVGPRTLLVATAVAWPLAAWLATRISNPLKAPGSDAPAAEQVRQAWHDLRLGARRLVSTPGALGPIASISVDQLLIGLMTVLSLVVFKERFNEGVGSYGNIAVAGGIGVLLGTVTIGWLGSKLSKAAIVALAFALAGVAALAAAPHLVGVTILLVSFVLGLTYAWRKVPIDTLVQEAVPDRYRGRVFSVYDLAFSMARVLSAAAAVILIPRVSAPWLVAAVGAVYLLWTPVLPLWLRRAQWVRVKFYAGGRADETPRAIEIGGEEQPVEVLGSWEEEAGGVRRRRFRLEDSDGTLMEIASDPSGRWRLERQIQRDARSG